METNKSHSKISPSEALRRLDLTRPNADTFLREIYLSALAEDDLDTFTHAFEMYVELTPELNTPT